MYLTTYARSTLAAQTTAQVERATHAHQLTSAARAAGRARRAQRRSTVLTRRASELAERAAVRPASA